MPDCTASGSCPGSAALSGYVGFPRSVCLQIDSSFVGEKKTAFSCFFQGRSSKVRVASAGGPGGPQGVRLVAWCTSNNVG